MLAPHLAEEPWERLGGEGDESIHSRPWPRWDAEKAQPRAVTLVVQVNGKVRDKLEVAPGLSEEAALAAALASERVQGQIAGKAVRRTVYAAGKLLNIVVG